MDRSTVTAIRQPIRYLELACACLLVVLVGAFTVDVFSAIPGVTWLLLVVPGSLGLTALVGAGIDVDTTLLAGDGRDLGDWRWRLGVGLASLLAGVLAAFTLFWVVATVQTLLSPPERGGVLFGPLLALFTGVALAVLVFCREATLAVADR